MKAKQIKLPFVNSFSDYHEIDDFKESIERISDQHIKSSEIAFDGYYWAIFYVGKRPDKDTMRKMLLKAEFDGYSNCAEFLGKSFVMLDKSKGT